MTNHTTLEQQARDLLERAGVEDAQSFTAGDLVEIANLLGRVAALAAPVGPVAWLHTVRQHGEDEGEEDQALSFKPDNFPLMGDACGMFYSTRCVPLYTAPPAAQPVDAGVVEALKASAIAIFDGHESPYGARDVIEWYHGSLLVALSATQPAEQVARPAHPHKWQPYADIAFKCDLCGMVSQSGQENACTAQPAVAQPAPAIERAVLAAAVPPGHKVVPVEPFPSQRIAGAVALMRASDSDLDCTTDEIAAAYRAMIQAAPERTP